MISLCMFFKQGIYQIRFRSEDMNYLIYQRFAGIQRTFNKSFDTSYQIIPFITESYILGLVNINA